MYDEVWFNMMIYVLYGDIRWRMQVDGVGSCMMTYDDVEVCKIVKFRLNAYTRTC